MANIKIHNLSYLSSDCYSLTIDLNNQEIDSVRGGIQRPGSIMTPGGQHTDLSLNISRPFG